MLSLTTFAICLGITVLLLAVLWIVLEDAFLVPFLLLPPLLAALLTGAGTGRPNPLGNVLFFAFILLQVLLLAGGVYLAYPFLVRTVAGLIAALKGWQGLAGVSQTEHLRLVNQLLFLATASLVTERVVNAVGCRSQLGAISKGVLLERYAQPLFMHTLAFVVLFSTRNYLLAPGHYAPGYLQIGVLLVYGKYLLTSFFRNLDSCLALLHYGKAVRVRAEDLGTVLALLHAALFGYFLIGVFLTV
jgi:hypothetical protein